MTGPRDPIPANRANQQVLSERQQHHLDAISVAGEALYEAMHYAEGSIPPGEHQEHIFMTRRMNVAHTHIETALMFAKKAALEVS
jgi:hypothetical protein